jgi:hypothetical protein
MKQQKDSLIKNATTDPREPWELPKPTLRPGAEDFLKVPSLHGERRVAHAPARGIGVKQARTGGAGDCVPNGAR